MLGFLDADGTCDPRIFADLCRALIAENADIVLGNRMNGSSKMPLVRRAGNTIFSLLLSTLSSIRVHDTASGMRVVRRSCLPKLYPLPDGLHFTPAMSARAILSEGLSMAEVEMPYFERAGKSKLRIIKDGMRFLQAILTTAFLYRPSRPLTIGALLFLAPSVVLMFGPTLHYLRYRCVAEWMIYRFVVSQLAATVSCLLFCAAYLTAEISRISLESEAVRSRSNILRRFFDGRYVWYATAVLLLFGTALVLPSFKELIQTGATYEHWSRFIAMSLCWSVAFILMATKAVDYVLGLVSERVTYLRFRSSEQSSLHRGAFHAGTAF